VTGTAPPRLPRRLAVRIAVLTSVPILAVIVSALLVVDSRLTEQIHRTVAGDLARAALAFDRQMERDGEDLIRIGSMIARDPKFFAMLTLPPAIRRGADYRQTLEAIAREFQSAAGTEVFEITDERGRLAAGSPGLAGSELLKEALAGRPVCGYLITGGAAYRVAVVPVQVGGALVGALCLGHSVDHSLAATLQQTTRSEVLFTIDGRIAAGTLSPAALGEPFARRFAARPGAGSGALGTVVADRGERFLAYRGRVAGRSDGGDLEYFLLRSLDQETRVLTGIRRDLLLAGALVALLTLLVGLGISAGITRPVRRILEAAWEMRRGNYDAPLDVRSRDELGTLAREFDVMRQGQRDEIRRLEELDRMKSSFIAVASHELVTPVTTIKAYAELLLERGERAEPAFHRDALAAIRHGADTLGRLARDLTSMSLIDRHELSLALGAHDVGSVVLQVAAQAGPLAKRRGQRLATAVERGLVHPRLDPEYLRQAVMHLVLNAVRYTPDGGRIELCARREGSALVIEVRDTGIGIPEAERDRIFQRIYEVRDANRHSSGTIEFDSAGLGLGLSIARGIVAAHGGTIRVESEVGRGSLFSIVLPLPAARDSGAEPPALRRAG
jgi:signal transduction histidine kinase